MFGYRSVICKSIEEIHLTKNGKNLKVIINYFSSHQVTNTFKVKSIIHDTKLYYILRSIEVIK